jgi:tRNA pseudouridine13 synthase
MTIRRVPSDFIVREKLVEDFLRRTRPDIAPGVQMAVFELTKTSLSTPEATQRLAKALGISPGGVDHAGLKDKHALTTQHVTARVHANGKNSAPELSGPGWSARRVGFVADPIRAADIEHNQFTIVVRDVAEAAAREMHRRAHMLANPGNGENRTLHIVNYFGDQRFGSARHGEGWVAKHLIKGEFEQALRLAIGAPARKDSGSKRAFTRLCATHWGNWTLLAKELPRCPEKRSIELLTSGGSFKDAFAALPHFLQQICVEAYQSHLWNAAARGLTEQIAAGASAQQVCRADDPFGVMVFPGAKLLDQKWREIEMPLLATTTQMREPWHHAAAAVLAEENLKLEDLRIPGLRRPAFGEAIRPLFVEASTFIMSPPETDDLGNGKRKKVTLSFELPRGAYATVLLRALGQ